MIILESRRYILCVSTVIAALPWFARDLASAAAGVPRSVHELWAGFDPRKDPLETEVLKEWEQDGVVCRIVRYQVGVFKGAPSRVAGFYAFPKGGTKLPAILEMHGGGQSASLNNVVTYARRGYAGISINWGGNKMSLGQETWSGPQTDWGRLDATHPPQRNKVNHFAGSLAPDEYTLDALESPRNSNWFLVLMAARRAITLLEQQPEVDATRIGAHGHSMGGKLTTNLAGIDKRIKAAVPSCGGSGDLLESETDVPGGSRTKHTAMELACISGNAYIPLITCPVLWLSPTNDFHAHIDNMAWNWRNMPDDRVRFSISPHLNHRHTDEHAITEYLWFEEHLKGAAFKMPQTPQMALELKTADGVPHVTVTPDDSQPVLRVDIYYSLDPHALTRFWRDAKAVKAGKQWNAECPVMNLDQPIFAYANVVYETPALFRTGAKTTGQENSGTFAISSRVLSAGPAQLQSAKVKSTDKSDRLIDDGARGWHDWYLLNWEHPPLWTATTRKLKDAKWRGPDGATLHFEIKCESDNQLVLTFNCNAWGAMVPGKPAVDYSAVKVLKGSPDWQTVSVKLSELFATDPKVAAPLANWQTVTEFSISPHGDVMKDGQKVQVDAKVWKGSRAIRNLRWEGGDCSSQKSSDAAIHTASAPPIVGAIRWDGWYGDGGVVKAVESSLGQPKYHFRLPWFARVIGEGKVSINGDSQAIMEQEIAYAAQVGLNYWAFLDYLDEAPSMSIGLNRYLAAKDKKGISYCLVEEGVRLDKAGTKAWSRFVEHFRHPDYQTVLGGRPLLCLFGKTAKLGKAEWDDLKRQTIAAAMKAPYLVLMGWEAERDRAALGFDAISEYACSGKGYTTDPESYERLTSHSVKEKLWGKWKRERTPCITFATAGWDTRPRQERPPSWCSWVKATPDPTPPAQQKPLIDATTATPDEIAAHVRAAIEWTQANRDLNPANAIIIYAWNEHDEGGWLQPTLGTEGQPDDARIKALAKVLRGPASPKP